MVRMESGECHGPPAKADETVAELLAREPRAVRILLGHGMHCVGCAIARFETLAEVCAIYG